MPSNLKLVLLAKHNSQIVNSWRRDNRFKLQDEVPRYPLDRRSNGDAVENNGLLTSAENGTPAVQLEAKS
jgi:hypothetical protein